METRLSGFQVEGTWEQVVDHGDRMSRILHDLGAGAHPRMGRSSFQDALDEWDDWRPRPAESFETDVRTRTAEQASLGPGAGEQRGRAPLDDLERAWMALLVGPGTVPDGGASELGSRMTEAARLTARAVDTGMRRVVRNMEEAVYLHLMTRTSPCYFDNRIVSANLDRGTDDGEAYRFEVNVNSDRLKEQVAKRLETGTPGPGPDEDPAAS